MKKHICIIGSGAREHAIGWKLQQSQEVGLLSFLPGNGGTLELGKNIPIAVDDIPGICTWVIKNKPDLVVVGPEVPLGLGLVDSLKFNHFPVIGPTKAAAQLETSKSWATSRLKDWGVPHPRSHVFTDADSTIHFLESIDWAKEPHVI